MINEIGMFISHVLYGLFQNFELDPKYNSKLNQDGTQRNGKDSPDEEDVDREAKDDKNNTTDTGQS